MAIFTVKEYSELFAVHGKTRSVWTIRRMIARKLLPTDHVPRRLAKSSGTWVIEVKNN